jgi:DNA-binding NarL/FixJ family response regulator
MDSDVSRERIMTQARILVVEDHALLRDRLVGLLADTGAQVIGVAGEGGRAIAETCALDPDVVLLDLSLPDCSGLDVLKTLQQAAPRTKVIILTAYEDPELERICLAAGAAAFVGKSRLRPELEAALARIHIDTAPAPERAPLTPAT